MLKKLQKKSKEKLSGLSQVDLQQIYLKAVNFFEPEELPSEISVKTVHELIWSKDPIESDCVVLDFCEQNKLI